MLKQFLWHETLTFSEIFNWAGNYLKFYDAIKSAYPDIKIITNCDASSQQLDHPADLYDYHVCHFISTCFKFQLLPLPWLLSKNKITHSRLWSVVFNILIFLVRFIQVPVTFSLEAIISIRRHVVSRRCIDNLFSIFGLT